MISLRVLLDMVATDAIEGGPQEHYFDESRNREFMSNLLPEHHGPEPNLPPIQFDLELIQNSDGSYEWIEDKIIY